MEEPEPTKEETIAEINRLLADWQPRYCRYLLKAAQGWHKSATAPPIPKNESGREFSENLCVHARDEATEAALCKHDDATQLVPTEDFEKLDARWKCLSCVNLLNKRLRGEKIPYERTNWLRPSQEELIRAIYVAGGRKAKHWRTTEELHPRTKYSSRNSLWTALRILKSHKVIRMKRKGNVCSVRLICDCVIEADKGELLIAAGKILDAKRIDRRKGRS